MEVEVEQKIRVEYLEGLGQWIIQRKGSQHTITLSMADILDLYGQLDNIIVYAEDRGDG